METHQVSCDQDATFEFL